MHTSIILPTFGLPAHTALMIYIVIGLAIFALIFGRRLKLVPGKGQLIIELVYESFMRLVEETMGHKGKKYLPLVLTFAFFIFIANAMGHVPGLIPPTANLNTTLGLALIVF